jgi:hypothetical protein
VLEGGGLRAADYRFSGITACGAKQKPKDQGVGDEQRGNDCRWNIERGSERPRVNLLDIALVHGVQQVARAPCKRRLTLGGLRDQLLQLLLHELRDRTDFHALVLREQRGKAIIRDEGLALFSLVHCQAQGSI